MVLVPVNILRGVTKNNQMRIRETEHTAVQAKYLEIYGYSDYAISYPLNKRFSIHLVDSIREVAVKET